MIVGFLRKALKVFYFSFIYSYDLGDDLSSFIIPVIKQ